jgi:hypothetical protein
VTAYDGPRRWTTPEGATIALVHLTGTGNTTGPLLRSPRSRDGWHLTVTAPSGVTLSQTPLPDLGDPEPHTAAIAAAELDQALDAVGAVCTGSLARAA